MKVTEVGATVTIKRDVGYQPYIEYLRTLNGAQPPFGTRNHSTTEISLHQTALLENDDDPGECTKTLIAGLKKEIYGIMEPKQVSDAGNDGDQPDTIELVQVTIDDEEVDFE